MTIALLVGDLTGSLVPGHQYQWWYEAFIVAPHFQSFPPATGSGTFDLVLVPEPTTAALLGLGLAGLAMRRAPLS